jgi:hypothetical protein
MKVKVKTEDKQHSGSAAARPHAQKNSAVSRATMALMPDKTALKRAYRKTPKCPHCQQELTRSEVAAMLSAQRLTRRGGRPRKTKGNDK